VEVLGTSFNVNAYTDEEAVNTTLVEGKVRFSAYNGKAVQLVPGQQASLAEVLTVHQADVEEVIAWKSGWFQFNHATVSDIMRQISRWYDVDIKFEGKPVNKTFTGLVSRNNNISDVLNIMERAGVKFRIEGKTIIVL
jgi:ferric-dicitrate binding protein FerR (iron transport regulator)